MELGDESEHLPVEHGPHDGVEGAFGDEVVDVDRGRLADAVGPVLGLLDVARVPVELGEHHVGRSGEGQTLGRRHTHTFSNQSQRKVSESIGRPLSQAFVKMKCLVQVLSV